MQISEVRVKLTDHKNQRLRAYCSVTFDSEFVVRDIKIIEGPDGYFVAMPSRKLSDHCDHCGGKNHLHAHYCNYCGKTLQKGRMKYIAKEYAKSHFDIAHPINPEFRRRLEQAVVDAFKKTAVSSYPQDVYRCRYGSG